MNTNPTGSGGERPPMGQCPLCYTDNAYSVSRCAECHLPLPWAKAEVAEREPCGTCHRCQTENPYTMLNCSSCGSRLPWSNAVSAVVQKRSASTQMAMMSAPAGSMPTAAVHTSFYQAQGHTPVYAPMHDAPNQIIDAVSFLCPPLGFVSYVTLLGTMPRQALNAAKFALLGLCVWSFVAIVLMAGPIKFGRRSLPSAPAASASLPPGAELEIYQ